MCVFVCMCLFVSGYMCVCVCVCVFVCVCLCMYICVCMFCYQTFQEGKKEYLRAKIEDLDANSKINNIRDLYRGINDLRRGTSLDVI